MRIAHKTALVVLFLLLIEVLYLHVDPVSFGFPFRSVEYRSEDITGTSWSWLGEEQPFGFNVEPILLVCDVLVVLFLSLLLIRCVPAAAIVPVVQGCVLGSVTGAADFWLDKIKILSEPRPSATGVLIAFVFVPLIIYILSLKHKWQKTAMLIISFTTVTTFRYAFVLLEALLDGTYGVLSNLGVILRLLAFTGVLAFACFVMMLLHKKVLPVIWRKKKLNSLTESMANNLAPKLARSPKQKDRKSTIKNSILYASLLAITVYVGYHFMTVRKMRHNSFLISDAIESELEQLEVPLKGRIWLMEYSSESFEAGWNASCRVEVEVDDENMYYAKVRKRLLIPWIQVEIYKKGTATQTDASHSSLE